jgi:ATP-dependent Clp protease ATP-binding subunit ClpA
MIDNTSGSDFERVINRSFDLAVSFNHEYVTTEHMLMALLEQPEVLAVLHRTNVNINQLTKDVQQFLADSSKHSMVFEPRFQPKYTTGLLTLIKQAKTQSMFLGRSTIESLDLLVAMFNSDQSWAYYFLNSNTLSKIVLLQAINSKSVNSENHINPEDAISLLSQFATNLNAKARRNSIDPLIGRESDVAQIVETLARKRKNNVLLVGHPGTGKTQIVEGLAVLIEHKKVPDVLACKEIWSLDVSSVVAGTKFRGDFEERMKNLVSALRSLPNVILFVDEIHMIMGAGSGGAQSNIDVANILKPALGRGEIRTIGATTHEEFRKYFEKDRALLRRFTKQMVEEPTPDDAKKILAALIPSFESYHNLSYEPMCVETAVDLSVVHIHNKHLPDKAIDLIDAAGAASRVNGLTQVTKDSVVNQLSKLTGIAVQNLCMSTDTPQHTEIESQLRSTIFGQDSAVTQVANTMLITLSGLRENQKTMGSFLFSGPSGVGKTELAFQLSQCLKCSFVRLDMSEFQEKHSVSRLIGSPPGYVGFGDGSTGSGALINELEQNPNCVLLIDEAEKAHPDVLNIFLQAMDRGVITSASQKTVSLSRVLLIFTSNLGSDCLSRSPIGFGDRSQLQDPTGAIRQFFAPEFRNRLDASIVFDPLTPQACESVVSKFLTNLSKLCAAKLVNLVVDPSARSWLAVHGFDREMGARPLSRCIDTHIKIPLSREMLFGRLTQGGCALVSVDKATNQLKLDCISNVKVDCNPAQVSTIEETNNQ